MNISLTLLVWNTLPKKDGVLSCWPAASNSPAMAGSVNFFDCKVLLHHFVCEGIFHDQNY